MEQPSEEAIARILSDLDWVQRGPHDRYIFYDTATLDCLIAQGRVDRALLSRIIVYRNGAVECADARQ